MSLQEIREGIAWEQRDKSWLLGYCWFGDSEEDIRVAHRRCWKSLRERDRRRIRRESDKAPVSLGQMV